MAPAGHPASPRHWRKRRGDDAMPFASIRLIPGVNVEQTQSLNETGYSISSLIRFRQGLAEKRGGWSKFITTLLNGVPRALLAWVDTTGLSHVGVGTTSELDVITNGAKAVVTPQTVTTNNAPNFSTVMSSQTVTIIDAGYTTGSLNDTAFLATPVTIGGIVLFGAYAIASIGGAHTYTITAASAASSTVNNAGAVPSFTTSSGSATVTVTLASHGYSVGSIFNVLVATAVGGITISGNYTIQTIVSSSQFLIQHSAQASSAATVSENSGNAQFTYYLAIPPSFTAQGYGLGAYGAGAYGVGTATSRSGTAITATDWTLANWGRILVANAPGGPIYQWDPITAYVTAYPITTAPFAVNGICIAAPQQIMIAWGADFLPNADPLQIRWSDAGNFNTWVASSTNQAGGFRIPSGGKVVAVVPSPITILVFTDIEVWAMQYVGVPFVFGFTKLGSNCGLIGTAAVCVLNTQAYWMGNDNFYVYSGGAVQPIPCPIWDVIFQNLNSSFVSKIRAGTTSEFNEVIWHYPSSASGGENDCYVQYNVVEQTWDFGPSASMPRSAWTDPGFTVAPTLAATPTGILYKQETSPDADGSALAYSFTTGYAAVGDGEVKPFIDWIIPDFKFGTYRGSPSATVQFSVNVVDFPSDTPTTFGPFNITSSTEGVPVRIRNRLLSFTVAGNDLGSFARLGRVRYRWAPDGRR